MFLHDTSLKIFSILFSAIFFCINADNSPAGGLLDKQTQLNNNVPGLFPPPNNKWEKRIMDLNANFMACVNGVIKNAKDNKYDKDDDYLNDCYNLGDIIDGSLKDGDSSSLPPLQALRLFRLLDMARYIVPLMVFVGHNESDEKRKNRLNKVIEYLAAATNKTVVDRYHYIKGHERDLKGGTAATSNNCSLEFLARLEAVAPVGSLLVTEAFTSSKKTSTVYEEYASLLDDILLYLANAKISDPSRENFFPFTILMDKVLIRFIPLWADMNKKPKTLWEWFDVKRYGQVKPKQSDTDNNQPDISLNTPADEWLKTLDENGLLAGPETFRIFNSLLNDDTMYSPKGAIKSKLPVNLRLSKDLFSNEGIELMYYFFLGSFSNVKQSGLPICGKPVSQVNLNFAISGYINDILTPTLKEIQNKVKKDAPVSPLTHDENETLRTAHQYAIWFNMFRLIDVAFSKSGNGYVWDRTLNPNRFAGFDKTTADNIDYICNLFAVRPK